MSGEMMGPIGAVLGRLESPRRSGKGWTARCPAHEDQKASLSVGTGADGRVLLRCHRGCTPREIVESLGLRMRDLFSVESRRSNTATSRGNSRGRPEATYSYRDEHGEELFQVVRYADPKDFRQRHSAGKGDWIWNLNGVRRVPYRLPELRAAIQVGRTIYLPEGEKHVDRLMAAGRAATCNPGGAGKWMPELSEHLTGARVVILPDNDPPDPRSRYPEGVGLAHARDIARKLHGVASEIRILELPNLPPKGDVLDWLGAGGTVEELDQLAASAPRWQPAPPPGPAANRFRVLSDTEIENLPLPAALIEGMLLVGSLAVLYGEPGAGKSLLALAWAFAIATGIPWESHPVKRGRVLYVVAEGSAGMGARVRAMKTARGITGEAGVQFISGPVILNAAADVEALLSTIRSLPEPPVLVVIDPVARCYDGDENSTADMSAFVAGADRIRREIGAAVLVVHHTNAVGQRERGNTALRGGADTMMLVRSRGGRLALSCEKQRDLPHFDRIALSLVPTGESCVVVGAEHAPDSERDPLTPKQAEALDVLRTRFPASGATSTDWRKASELPKRTFDDARIALVKAAYVQPPTQTRGGRYTLTDEGKKYVGAKVRVGAEAGAVQPARKVRAAEGAYKALPPHRSPSSHPPEWKKAA